MMLYIINILGGMIIVNNKEEYLQKVKDLEEAKKVIPKGSYYELNFKGTKKVVINKKGVYHLKALYGVKTEMIEYKVYTDEKGRFDFCYHVYKAISPDGEEALGFAGADRREFSAVHNAISTSSTRAEIRAILELIAFGDLSGIEFVYGDD